MTVVKAKRKQSDFEVFHYYCKLRKEITYFLLYDFGWSKEKAIKKVEKQFGGRTYDDLNDDEKNRYDATMKRNKAFDEWYIVDERKTILDCLRKMGKYIYSANAIYPQYWSELEERRLLQEKALGCCEYLTQELQFSIETISVDINRYTRFADMIQREIVLIKGWRKSDNKFKKTITNNLGKQNNQNKTK